MTTAALRVLHVVRSLDVGGVERGVINVVQGLDRQGFTQAVCCLEGAGRLAAGLPASVALFDCGGGRVAPVLRAARAMGRFQPHITHARNCGAWLNGGVAWRLAGAPGRLMFSIHGLDWVGPVPAGRARLYRLLARMSTALVAVSRPTAEHFAAQTGISPSRFGVLPSGVDVTRFQPGEGGQGVLRLGCVARLGQQKGHHRLIDAFAAAVARSARPLELWLIGDGPYRAELEACAVTAGVADRVRFLGEVEDVPARLRALDIFILASEQEGRPTSIMEAMAAGLPVIATQVGAVADLVRDGVTGRLVAAGDGLALCEAILQLAGDAALRRQFGHAARADAEARLSLDAMVDRYATFYRALVD